jgi:hypothetical protein
VASANPDEPYAIESAKNDQPEMQQAIAGLWMMPQHQAPASAILSILPSEPADSFEERWTGLQRAEPALPFNARWALDSK